MMKMRREEFYVRLLAETAYKPSFNPEFVNQTNQYNIAKKKELISMLYDKLSVSRHKYNKNHEKVENCPDEVIHNVFKKLYSEAVEWAENKGLEAKVLKQGELFPIKSDFERHLGALDGAGYYRYHYKQ